MVKPKQNGEEHGKGQGGEDLGDAQLPETNEPAPATGGHEGNAGGQTLELYGIHAAHVDKAGEEDEGQRGAIVLEEEADGVAEEGAGAELAA